MTPRRLLSGLAVVLWLGGAVLAAGDAVEGLGRLLTRTAPPPPGRLTAGLELTRNCAARLPAGDELLLWSATAPAEPESFGFLWILASYREYPRPVAPLFPESTIDLLERRHLLDSNLAALLRGRIKALPARPVRGFIVWSDRGGAVPRCESFPQGTGAFEAAETNGFGRCCLLRSDAP